jgi:hypothetical protein
VGTLSRVALATQDPFHLCSDKASSSAAELVAACDVLYEAMGAPSWAALAIHFTVSTMARYATNPGPTHWDAAKQTDRYLVGTLDLWLVHGETTCTLEGCVRDVSYCEAVGALDRAAQVTPLNTISITACIAATPRPTHQEAKRINRYPAGMLDPRLAYGEATRALEGYANTDSNTAAHHCTTSGHVPLIDHGAIPGLPRARRLLRLHPLQPQTHLRPHTRSHHHTHSTHTNACHHQIKWAAEQGTQLIHSLINIAANALAKASPPMNSSTSQQPPDCLLSEGEC